MQDTGTGLEATGHPEVDAALSRLAELDTLPVAAHPEVFEGVQARLQGVLADLDPR